MKNKIKEVQDYFKNKIINGEYKIASKGAHTWKVVVDESYEFNLWICNGETNFSCYSDDYNFIGLNFSRKEASKGFRFISKEIEKHQVEVLMVERKKQFEALKKEFEPKN